MESRPKFLRPVCTLRWAGTLGDSREEPGTTKSPSVTTRLLQHGQTQVNTERAGQVLSENVPKGQTRSQAELCLGGAGSTAARGLAAGSLSLSAARSGDATSCGHTAPTAAWHRGGGHQPRSSRLPGARGAPPEALRARGGAAALRGRR